MFEKKKTHVGASRFLANISQRVSSNDLSAAIVNLSMRGCLESTIRFKLRLNHTHFEVIAKPSKFGKRKIMKMKLHDSRCFFQTSL